MGARKATKKKKDEVIFHPDLVQAMKGFRPEFPNNDDRVIAEDLAKLHRKASTIDCKQLRKLENEKSTKGITAKMKEVQRDEQSLIRRIISRNLDF